MSPIFSDDEAPVSTVDKNSLQNILCRHTR
jgi:hypothetical protein